MKIIDMPEFHDKKELLIMDKESSVLLAAQKMKKLNYGAVIVAQKDKLMGIFTERDLLMKIAAMGKEIKGMKLKDVMTKKIKFAKISDNVTDALAKMKKGRFRHLPVIDAKGKIAGMISQGDFVAMSWDQLIARFKTQTKDSFAAHTQIWMLILGVIGYLAIVSWTF